MTIDRNKPVPLYVQLRELWQHQIARGELEPGAMLPPEHELCRQYDVSPITVKQAMRELVREGLLVRERGRGTFVARRRTPTPELTRLSDLAEELEAAGVRATADVVRRERLLASDDLAEIMELSSGASLIHLERVYHDGPDVLAVEQVFLPAELFSGLLDYDPGSGSLYALMEERYWLRPVKAEQFVEAVAAYDRDARLLRVPEGSPVLQAERLTADEDGRILEYSRLLYRGDRYKFRVSQTRQRP